MIYQHLINVEPRPNAARAMCVYISLVRLSDRRIHILHLSDDKCNPSEGRKMLLCARERANIAKNYGGRAAVFQNNSAPLCTVIFIL